MKKIIRSAILAIFFIVLSLIFSCGILEDDTKYAKISSGNISTDGFVYDLYENGAAHITGWKNPGLMLYIPDEIDGKPVTAIESSAFAGEEGIMYLKLGKNVSEIGNFAFSEGSQDRRFCLLVMCSTFGDQRSFVCFGCWQFGILYVQCTFQRELFR